MSPIAEAVVIFLIFCLVAWIASSYGPNYIVYYVARNDAESGLLDFRWLIFKSMAVRDLRIYSAKKITTDSAEIKTLRNLGEAPYFLVGKEGDYVQYRTLDGMFLCRDLFTLIDLDMAKL